MAGPTGTHVRRDIRWSPRQKQVLDLLAKRRTNGQIAEELGISLDGAKYHVSEVITKLDVDSREEAAEWWRQQKGLRARLRVLTRTGSAPAVVRWLGLGGAGASALAVVAIVSVVIIGGGADQEAASPEQTPVEVATEPVATSVATPNVPDDDRQDSATLTEIGGVPVRELTVGNEVEMPSGAVLYYQRGCYGCGDLPRIWRAYLGTSGAVVHDQITPMPTDEGHIDAFAMSPDGQELFATLCSGSCGGEVLSQPGSTKVALVSTDGGITWQEGKPLPVTTQPLFLYKGDWLLLSRDEDDLNATFWLYDSGDEIRPPHESRFIEPILRGRGGLAWQERRGVDGPPAYFGTAGNSLGVWPQPERDGYVTWSTTGESAVAKIFPNGALDEDNPLHVATIDSLTVVRSAFSWGWGAMSDLHLVNSSTLLTTIEIPFNLYPQEQDRIPPGPDHTFDFDVRAAFIDLEDGTVHPIQGLPRGPDGAYYPAQNYTFPQALVQHQQAPLRVETGGSCLNVREEPSTDAEIVRCYVDGVLLFEREAEEEVDGWLPVRTPDGREGWASAEFVER